MEVDGEVASGGGGAVAPASKAEQFALLKGAVKDCPGDYTAHLFLVKHLRGERPGSLELLKARQDFSERFPLGPELWQEWIDDRRAAGGEDGAEDILALYRRAFADYQCAKLWPGYLETLEASLDEDDEGGVSAMREAFEEALTRVGVHPVLGGAVWRSLLRFEMEELEDAEEMGVGDGEIAKARDRVKRVYRRQLSVPLIGNDESRLLEDMKEAFSGDDAGLKEVAQAHAKASKMLAARMEHEQAVKRCQEKDPGGPGEANAWEAYAAMEAADGHPSRAALALERAESEGCCLHERIWVTHSDLLLAQMGAKDEEEKLTARAVRNLPWSAELWCRRLRSLERSSEEAGGPSGEGTAGAEAAMRRVWKEALGSSLPSPDEYVKILLAYCASFRRRLLLAVDAVVKAKPLPGTVEASTSDGARRSRAGIAQALEAMRGAFDEAEAFVDKNYPGWDEGWLCVVRRRIQIEDELVEDIADLDLDGVAAESQARRQWDRVLRHSGKRLVSWEEAIKWERRSTGDLAACRRLYARSLNEVQDYPEAACTAYLNFEEEIGSLEDWDAANKGVFNSRASRGLLSRDLPLASRSWAGGVAARPLHQPTQRQQQQKARKQQQHKQEDRGGKRNNKRSNDSAASASPAEGESPGEDSGEKKKKRARTSPSTEAAAAAGSHLATTTAAADKGKGLPGNQAAAGGGPGGVEGLTVFVMNLPFSAADAGLRGVFQGCGEVASTRVLTGPNGRSKGLGYVTFANEEALAKALALDGTDMDGRTLSVQRSLPRGSRSVKGGSAASATAATPPPPPPAAAAAGEGGAKEAEESDITAKKSKKKKKKKAEGEVVVAASGIKWPAHPTTVFVRGLGLSATSQDLREAFVGVGPMVEARVVEDKRTRETKGYGLVQFEEGEAVEKALALDGTSMCGGTAQITRSRHPAVVAAPAPAPASSDGVETPSGDGDAAPADGKGRRANDWDCPSPDCDNVCFSFRTKCNRCGMGKDGTPPPKELQQGGGGNSVVATQHRPRLQLGAAIRPRALRNERSTNGAARKPVGGGARTAVAAESKGGAREDGESSKPPPSKKSNADFRALFNGK
ncbi:Sart3 protein [Ectocarpus siliculosus]|uniref:Sart3 protein n=1 Tax=Ectocarpus siliculosus TaxID=2880 RepID=D8LJP0_ECTSI|nr:Sart3 protein [Ectocarpus siliculosus]|eukprot:CBN77067.1 Sart3 protein [Ectocarpus siliculosus]